MRVHATVDYSTANGPGHRAVLWVQGCTRKCPGCFNPETHDTAGGIERSVENLIEWFKTLDVEGISVSGGEPLAQARELKNLLQEIRKLDKTVTLFTGYTWAEVQANPEWAEVAALCDMIVAGPYRNDKNCAGIQGSSNQAVVFPTGRYSPLDLSEIPDVEVIIGDDGTMVMTGIGLEAL